MSKSDRYFFRIRNASTKMKAIIIKDDDKGQKKDSAKLATIKKNEKSGDPKISVAKKISMSKAIIEAANKTSDPTTSTTNENLFSHLRILKFTNPQKAFTPLASTSTSGTSSKDPELLGSTPKSLKSQNSVPGVQSVEENTTCFNHSLINQLSLTPGRPSIQKNRTVPYLIKSSKSVIGAQPIKENTLSFKDLSSTTKRQSMQNSLVDPYETASLPNTVVSAQIAEKNCYTSDNLSKNQHSTTVKSSKLNSLISNTITSQQAEAGPNEKTITLDDSLTDISQFLASDFVTSYFNLVSKTMNFSQSTAAVEPMKENDTFDDLLEIEELFNTTKSSFVNNSCVNNKSEQFEIVNLEEEESSTENFDADKSSNMQKVSVPVSPPAHSSLTNILEACNKLKTLQSSMLQQRETSKTTKKVIKKGVKTEPLQNSTIKEVKRRAADFFYLDNSANNLEDSSANKCSPNASIEKKKSKKKQKLIQSQISKKTKKANKNKNNSLITENSECLISAIVEEQYPNMPPLTNVHLGIVRNVIKEKIDNIPYGVFAPKFINAFIKHGVIMVECADHNSKEWLKHAITNYNPEEGIYLKVIPPEALNQYYPASIFVCDEENAINVLRRLQKQNSDISVRNWQYLSMTTVKESTPGITINVGIPATSVAQLKEKNFRLFHAMAQVSVIMKVPLPF